MHRRISSFVEKYVVALPLITTTKVDLFRMKRVRGTFESYSVHRANQMKHYSALLHSVTFSSRSGVHLFLFLMLLITGTLMAFHVIM